MVALENSHSEKNQVETALSKTGGVITFDRD